VNAGNPQILAWSSTSNAFTQTSYSWKPPRPITPAVHRVSLEGAIRGVSRAGAKAWRNTDKQQTKDFIADNLLR